MSRLHHDPLQKGHGGGGCLCLRGNGAAWESLLDSCEGAVAIRAPCGSPAAWSSSMPLAAIRELSSLSARSGRIATNESSERKGCLRPARITRRSQTASLRLSEAQRQRRGTEGAVRNGFSKHPVWKAPKKCGVLKFTPRLRSCTAGAAPLSCLASDGGAARTRRLHPVARGPPVLGRRKGATGGRSCMLA